MKWIAASLIGFLVAVPTAAAELACDADLTGVREALEHAHWDAYTKRQVDAELDGIKRAQSDSDNSACQEAVDRLKYVLHLDH